MSYHQHLLSYSAIYKHDYYWCSIAAVCASLTLLMVICHCCSRVEMLRSITGNDQCCDCGALEPSWASINLGITLCIECSGIHRYLILPCYIYSVCGILYAAKMIGR